MIKCLYQMHTAQKGDFFFFRRKKQETSKNLLLKVMCNTQKAVQALYSFCIK